MRTCSRCVILKDDSEFLSKRGRMLKQCSQCREKIREWSKNKTDTKNLPEQKICPVCCEEKSAEKFLARNKRPTKRCTECIHKSKILENVPEK